MPKTIDVEHLVICHQEAISVLVAEIGSLRHLLTELESLVEQQGTILKRLLAFSANSTDNRLSVDQGGPK